jgi:hypothetical protein
MFYGGSVGHGWVVLIPFAVVMAMRMFGPSRRRRGGNPRRRPVPGTPSSLVSPSVPPPGVARASPGDRRGGASPEGRGGDIGSTGIAPGWLVDPAGRHEHRYWSGSEWTEHVTDAGVPGIDPPPGRRGTNEAE